MRMRKKKHLSERVFAAGDMLIAAKEDIFNSEIANADKIYFDFKTLFNNDNRVEIEIGCGKGGFITEKAKRNADVNYIAVELLKNIAVTAAENALRENLNNVRIFNCGADYLPRYIPPKSIDAIYLNFSPPYPSKRHENRRLTKDSLVKEYKSFLKNGGRVYQKTDDKEFFEYSLKSFKDNGFIVKVTDANAFDNVLTEYEKKFRDLGMPIYSLTAIKPE